MQFQLNTDSHVQGDDRLSEIAENMVSAGLGHLTSRLTRVERGGPARRREETARASGERIRQAGAASGRLTCPARFAPRLTGCPLPERRLARRLVARPAIKR